MDTDNLMLLVRIVGFPGICNSFSGFPGFLAPASNVPDLIFPGCMDQCSFRLAMPERVGMLPVSIPRNERETKRDPKEHNITKNGS